MIKKYVKSLFFVFFVASNSFAQNNPPVVENDYGTTDINTTLNITVPGLLGNDSDPDGDTLTVIQFVVNGTTFTAGQAASFTQGNITISTDGSFTFIPTLGYTGGVPAITYIVSDGIATGSAFLFLTVNTPPVVENDYDTTDINTTLNVTVPGLLGNDSDLDGDTLTVIQFVVNGTTFTAGQAASFTQGSITINTDGSFTFIPTLGYTGSVPAITYIVSDGTATDSAFLFLTVNNPPVVENDFYITEINTTLNVNAPGLLGNDSDPDGDTLNVEQFIVNGTTYTVGQTANFAEGSLTINTDGSFTVIPTPDYTGDLAVITYIVSDGATTASAFLFLTVNNPPVVENDFYIAEINTTLNVNAPGLLGNDSDPDGDTLNVEQFIVNGTTYTVGQTANFAEGSLTINANGSFTFIPTPSYTGDVPVITYIVSDGATTASAFLFLTVNNPPVVENDFYIAEINTTLNINAPGLLGNDSDPDGDTLNVEQFIVNGTTYTVGQTANFAEGSITINTDGSFTFIPTPGYTGDVPVITYIVSDGTATGSAFLFLTVNNAPIPENDYDTADINTTLNVTAPGVLGNDSDPDGDTLTVVQFIVNGTTYTVGQTANFAEGSITINTDGSFTFIPTPGYTGDVPVITYIVSDGTATGSAFLFLTVEQTTNLLEISSINSCNQGYTAEGEYKIIYNVRLRNLSTARDYHSSSIINNINLTDDLESVFGNSCVIEVDQMSISTIQAIDYVNNPYPLEWDNSSINPDFENINSTSIFNSNAINNNVLYPRQSIYINFCVTVNPFCNGRPNPTPSGSGVNFDNIVNVTSSTGNDTNNRLITDFHTSEAIVAGNLFIPETSPVVNFDGTYDYTNTVKLTNEGSSTANNINYNLGLGDFLDNGITFNNLIVTQVSGPTVTINNSYNGDDNTKLLSPNNSLAPNETVVLEISHLIGTVASINENYFIQLTPSMTQGNLDGFNETLPQHLRSRSFIIWSDSLGDHLDRYYVANSITNIPTSNDQCTCGNTSMIFTFESSSTNDKIITNTIDEPNGILEHQEVTFQLTATNTSSAVQIENLQLQDNLNSICGGNIISISNPTIITSTAITDPILNSSFDGISDVNIFNGTSGILEPNQSITVEFTVLFNEDCIGVNTSNFSATDPLNNTVNSSGNVNVINSTDSDNDGISNINDIDDDNDTVPDTIEYNGLDPLDDDDGDSTPNYRDVDFGTDSNSDGIIDVFDFDLDGVPNHFDLDSDNDGILDIVEVGNTTLDTTSNGETNNNVGANGLDDTIEDNDTVLAIITYTIPNTDSTGNPNYLDIDSDGDGIVDNIEGQATDSYTAPNGTISATGIDTAYTTGITPVDTDSDAIFDYIDINSDNDIRDDFIEGWDLNNDGTPETITVNLDSDNDGLDNAFDTNNSLINPTNGQIPTDFPNVDNTTTTERDWREIIAIVVMINDVSVNEGGDLIFTISLVTMNDNSILIQSATPIDIDLSTSDGTDTTTQYEVATTPFDYDQILTTTLTIPPFQSTEQFTVTTLDDIIFELDEQLTLNGVITSNNTINTDAKGVGTIIDNELPPTITMNDSREDEGVDLVHTIMVSHPSSTPIDIHISTSDNTAINPLDYTSFNNSLTIEGTFDPSNINIQTSFNITTNIDNLNEPDEEYINVVGIVTSNNVGNQDLDKTGTIVDIDPDPTIIIDNPTVVEGNTLVFTISLLNANDEPMQNYQSIDLDLMTSNISANAPEDYNAMNLTTIIPAFTEFIITEVPTIDDELNEETETMELQVTVTSSNISNPSPVIQGIGTIKDNDIPNLFSPNGDGMSDVFEISGIEDFPDFKIQIFDRWGSEVHNYNNNGNTNPIWWDGNYKDKPVPEGVYYYTLDFNDGITKPKVSFIELIR